MTRSVWWGWVLCALVAAGCGDDGKNAPGKADTDGDADMDADGDSDGGDSDGDGDGNGDGDGDPDGMVEKRAWTFFVYGHGDHNLSNSLARDVLEMAEAQLDGDVHVVVFADFDASQAIAGTSDAFPTGSHWFSIEGNGAEPLLIESGEELSLDDPDVLANAVATAFSSFPSDKRALVMWDHGGSWNGGFGGDTQDGSAAAGSPMPSSVVAEAVRAGLDAAGITGPLDLLSFDTCLMAGAEVTTDFLDLTKVYIANAEIDYGDGWDYTAFLGHLAAQPDATLQKLAETEVSFWDAHHAQASANDTLLRSHVALDTDGFDAFVDAYGEFVDALLGSESMNNGIELGRAGYFSLPAYMNQLENPGDNPGLRDVGQFLSRVQAEVADPTVKTAAGAAKAALEGAILARSQGTIRESAGQSGVHIELPLASTMTAESLDGYALLASSFGEASGWGAALTAYGALNDGVAPTIQASIANGEAPDATHLPTVTFSAPEDDLAEAELNVGVFVDPQTTDEVLFYGTIAKGAVQPGASYEVPWNGQLTALPDGQGGLQAVYVRTWEDAGNDVNTGEAIPPLLATFGVVLASDGTEALGALLYQDGDAEAGLLALFDPPLTLPLADVANDLPGTTFTPVLVSVSLSTLSESAALGTTLPLDGPSLPISQGSAPPGAYALITSVTDVFGNVNSDLQAVTIETAITF